MRRVKATKMGDTPPYRREFYGWFHDWGKESRFLGRGKRDTVTVGIVEREDGQICFVEPDLIKFLDHGEEQSSS